MSASGSPTYKTVIQLSSAARRPRTGSDPLAYGSNKQRKASTSSAGKQDTPTEHVEIGQPCIKCGQQCPGYMQHIWRKQCLHCSCPRSSHTVDTEPCSIIPALEQLTLSDGPTRLSEEDVARLGKYTWYPPGVSYGMVEKYMQSLPPECVPAVGTEGESYRRAQCFSQLPLYDFSLEACHKLSDLEKKRMGKFTERRKTNNFGVGKLKLKNTRDDQSCTECLQSVTTGSVYIISERTGAEKAWHPQCFRCNTCHEFLVDLVHFYSPENEGAHSPEHDGIYCGRHHGELLVPRCAGCDELIVTSHYTEAQQQNWHKEHFCCVECDDSIHGKPHTNYQGRNLCERCYNKYAPKCHRCREPIGIGAKKCSHKGKSWHQECFVCKRCREDLQGERFFIVEGDLLCGDCMQPVAQCQGCKEGISPAVSYLQHNKRCWHAECFKCAVCRAWLVDGQFHEMEDSLMCNTCFVEKMSKKCEFCQQPITGKAIQFSLKVFHTECFMCAGCGESLEGQNGRVKERNGDPYCESCALKFAKKCYKCRGPITSRHTVYNNHTFHLECFQCNKCGTSVATGDFFETSLREILCARCAHK